MKKKAAPLPAQKNAKPKAAKKIDPVTERNAAQLCDLAQKRRDREERRAQADRKKEEERRNRAVERAQTALDNARERHEQRKAVLGRERDAIERRPKTKISAGKTKKSGLRPR